MATTPELFLFFFTIVHLNNKVSSDKYYVRPNSHDVIQKLPPLRFAELKSLGDVTGLKEELSNVLSQIQTLKNYKIAADVGAGAIGFAPKVGPTLKASAGILVTFLLLSISELENLKTDVKIKLGIQEEFAKQNLVEFKAELDVLQRHLDQMFDSNQTPEIQRTSAAQAEALCLKLLKIFSNEDSGFWKIRMIFYPSFLKFAALHAVVATVMDEMVPSKISYLKKDMALLKETIFKYYQVVKRERLSYLKITTRTILSVATRKGRQNQRKKTTYHVQDLSDYCPTMSFTPICQNCPPPPSFQSCFRGGHYNESRGFLEDSIRYRMLKGRPSSAYLRQIDLPEWFLDALTGEIFCGWEGCWNSLHEHYRKEIDNITKTTLDMIPYDAPHELPAENWSRSYSQCQLDGYHRLAWKTNWNDKEIIFDTFGCHKGYCWTYCRWGWCYTRRTPGSGYAQCKKNEDCCPEWECKGFCN